MPAFAAAREAAVAAGLEAGPDLAAVAACVKARADLAAVAACVEAGPDLAAVAACVETAVADGRNHLAARAFTVEGAAGRRRDPLGRHTRSGAALEALRAGGGLHDATFAAAGAFVALETGTARAAAALLRSRALARSARRGLAVRRRGLAAALAAVAMVTVLRQGLRRGSGEKGGREGRLD